MKTKIIYISGSEVFNMADVRMAFDTVRRELGLGGDTILFGVPVDADDALGAQFESVQPAPAHTEKTIVPEPTIVNDTDATVEKPKRRKKTAPQVVEPEPVIETVQETIVSATPEQNQESGVIPILSVLGGNATSTPEPAPDIQNDDIVDNTNNDVADEQFDTEQNITISGVCVDIIDDADDETTEQIDDTNTDTDEEDPLAKLLQSVQSLNDDKNDADMSVLQEPDNTTDETDATLEKLATEFAENQDKIVNTTKSSARGGRIGKLKNILPFKKSKHNESSLMGDLFGWAGVAANDEEFAIPEFFPTAAKK